MTNDLECTQCGNVVSTTARTVQLPFVCWACQKANQLYDMRPAQASLAHYDPSKDASIDATNLLIEDLQEQLHCSQLRETDLSNRVAELMTLCNTKTIVEHWRPRRD